jgi:hypothetical protein
MTRLKCQEVVNSTQATSLQVKMEKTRTINHVRQCQGFKGRNTLSRVMHKFYGIITQGWLLDFMSIVFLLSG